VEGVISTSDHLGKAATLELNKWKLSERGVQKLLDTGLTLIAQIKEMKVAIQQSRLALEEVAQSETAADVNTAASDYEKSVEAFGPIIDNMQRAFSSRSVSSSLRRLRNLHKQMKESGEVLINAQLQLLSQAEQAQQAMTQLDNEGNQATKLINQVVALAIEDMERAKQESQSASSQAGTLVIIVGLVAIASSLLLGTLITRSITLPLGGEPAEMRRIARTIADGDLTLTFDQQASDDCVYGAMREMSANLRAMIGNIVNSSSLLAATAEQSSATTEHTLNVIQEQHAKTDLVATAINEMSATVQDIAINTSEVASATDEAKRQGDEGLRTLTGATHAINQLVDQVSSASQAMTQMHDKSLEIGQVLEVIQGIAEQTNLLALNAAIEAARAGEQGRGFAVVADEVRTLAQRTQASASDIQTMIEAVQSAAGSATKTMQLSQAQAIQTSEHATHTSDAFNGIKDAVEKIRGMTLQVAAASEQQSHVAEEVKRNIAHIRELALQTSSSAEQLAGANNEVASSAETLNSIAVQFKV
jgi:methyl-accepting chemotaxis protein